VTSWKTATLSVPRYCLAATSVGSLVLLASGLSSNGVSNVVDIYNVTSNTWTTATLSQTRQYLAAATVGGSVAFGGGWKGSKNSTIVDMYNVASHTWFTANLLQPRGNFASTATSNKIFLEEEAAVWCWVTDC
jgi:hypothetical protein